MRLQHFWASSLFLIVLSAAAPICAGGTVELELVGDAKNAVAFQEW